MPRPTRVRHPLALALFAALVALAAPPDASAAAPSKEECIDAHSRGQDGAEKGQLTQARQLFLTCAQTSCPALIQADCARFGDEVSRLVPSVSFAARDARQNDLPDASVYVDDVLVATRLDDGKSYDLDPGKRSVRFVHNGRTVSLSVVLSQGEKGRTIVGSFADQAGGASPVAADSPSRPVFPLVVAGAGAAALITGGVLVGVGFGRVPSNCSVGDRECAAPVGDPAFGKAKDGVSLANTGFIVGGVGAAALVGGLIWYFASPREPAPTTAFAPYATPHGGGLALGGSF